MKRIFIIILIIINSLFLYSQEMGEESEVGGNEVGESEIRNGGSRTSPRSSPINESDLKNITIRTSPVAPKIVQDNKQINFGISSPSDYFVRNLKIKQITRNQSRCFILDKKNLMTLGHFSITKETENVQSFNNTILVNVYYVTDNALEPIAGLASQREVGFLVAYNNKYLASLSGVISTSIIEAIIILAGSGLIATSFILYSQIKDINNLATNLFDELLNTSYQNMPLLPFFIGGLAVISYGVIFASVVIVTAVFSSIYYNNYSALKKSIIDSLNNARSPISVRDKEGDTILKIGFDLLVN